MDEMSCYLSATDVALIPLKNIDLFKNVLPSKMFDAWACQRPIVLSVNGEARRVMEEAQAGVFVPPENPELLAETLIELHNSPDELSQMGLNGRKYVEANYSRDALAEKLLHELECLLGKC
jgi:glycosyltransferase involved in cell wall biosynthesis